MYPAGLLRWIESTQYGFDHFPLRNKVLYRLLQITGDTRGNCFPRIKKDDVTPYVAITIYLVTQG